MRYTTAPPAGGRNERPRPDDRREEWRGRGGEKGRKDVGRRKDSSVEPFDDSAPATGLLGDG